MTANKDSHSLEKSHIQGDWILWTTLAAIVLSCALSVSLNLVDPDLWGHVRYGQDWLAEGQLARSASHTFTALGHPWINHENLAELAFAEGYRLLGSYGLLVAKCLLGLGIFTAMVRTALRAGVHPLLAWALMLLVARNLTPFFIMRPQLFSFLWCGIVLVALDRAFVSWKDNYQVCWKWLMVVPLVMVAWVNSHGGFVAGLCIVGFILVGRIFEMALHRERFRWPTALLLAMVGLGCLAATLANPYGLQFHRWLLHSLGQPRPEIIEWGAPHPGDPVFWPFVSLVFLALVSLTATKGRRDWVQIVVLSIVAWQAAMHLRHISFFALLCGFWLPVSLQSALVRLGPSPRTHLANMSMPVWMRRSIGLLLIGAIGLQSYTLITRLTRFPVPRDSYPVEALQFMADHELGGKLVVCFNWAQYSIAALAPDVQVAFDGRFRTCYPQEVVDMHFDFLLGPADGQRWRSDRSGPVDGMRVLAFGNPDLVLVDRQYQHAVDIMTSAATTERPEWVLLYCDDTAELWGRRQRYNRLNSPHYFPHSARVLNPLPQAGALTWPALPMKKNSAPIAESLLTQTQHFQEPHALNQGWQADEPPARGFTTPEDANQVGSIR